MRLSARARTAFRAHFGGAPHVIAEAPGRLNIIGEHVDYAEGMALPAAIDRHVTVALRPARRARLFSPELGEERGLDDGGWARLVGGAVRLFMEAAELDEGVELLVTGDVPQGAGLSSSAATEMATLLALRAAFDAPLSDLDLVRLAQQVEHRFLGVRTGLMDQIAATFATPGHALLVDFAPLGWRPVPLDLPGTTWVVIDSGERHRLAHSGYDRRVTECAEGLRRLGLSSYRQLRPEHLRRADDAPTRRLRHVFSETARVREAVTVLDDPARLGALLWASHASLRDDHQVSTPTLDALVEAARLHPACHGARMMGGGFGGCTLNLVDGDGAQAFIKALGRPGWSLALVGGARLVDQTYQGRASSSATSAWKPKA